MTPIQPTAHSLELTLASGAVLAVRAFTVTERVSQLFTAELDCTSADPSLDLEPIIGQGAELRVQHRGGAGEGETRIWRGLCSAISQSRVEDNATDNAQSGYQLTLVPMMWLLTQRRNYRIFQHVSVPDIADAIFAEWGVEAHWALDRGAHPRLEYRVQYGETDHDFVCRLLLEAGIAFVFLPAEGDPCRLTLSDALEQRPPAAGSPLPFVHEPNQGGRGAYVTGVQLSLAARSNAIVVRDYDFRRPRYALTGQAADPDGPEPAGRFEELHYLPGGSVITVDGAAGTPVADGRGAARHEDAHAHRIARRELDEVRSDRRRVTFETNLASLSPGSVFHIDGHPHETLEAPLLVTELTLAGGSIEAWSIHGQAAFADRPYRSPRHIGKPEVTGVHTATVVGPAGEEIHTDEYGRVCLRFPWDRETNGDETSSCWVRVSQGWAGTGYGLITIPRIGQEVLVAFLAGDPDQPVVVGRVFNGVQQVPYRLPEHKTRSTWKSRSSPDSDGFNELMFEDLAGKELVYLQAERDMRKLVKHDETITVGRHRTKLVKGNETETTGLDRVEVTRGHRVELTQGDRLTVIGGSRRQLVAGTETLRTQGDHLRHLGADDDEWVEGTRRRLVRGDEHLVVEGERRAEIHGDDALIVHGEQHLRVDGRHALHVADEIHIRSDKALVIEAAEDLTLRGPAGFIRITADAVTIRGTLVKINSGTTQPGEGSGCQPAEAEVAIAPEIEPPDAPDVDDVSVTGLAQ